MDLRPLGNTGIRVSPIGLGTVKLGRNRGLKPGIPPFPLPTDDQASALLNTAADLGINLIDTAPAYGTSEARLGELMSRHHWFGGRDRWIISTKVGESFDPTTEQSTFDFSPAAVQSSIEASLRRLRCTHLDIALLHSDGRDEWILNQSGALEALRDLQSRGQIRAVGISTKSLPGALLATQKCDVVMLTYSSAHTTEAPAIDAAHARNVGILVKKGLESGRAADAHAAIRFVLAHPGVSAMVVGTLSPTHLKENVAAARPSES